MTNNKTTEQPIVDDSGLSNDPVVEELLRDMSPKKKEDTTERPRGGPGKPFVKGDARINRNGRPREFNSLRKLVQQKLTSPAMDSNGDQIFIQGRPVTVIEYLIQKMIESKNTKERQYLFELAYGKVPDEINLGMQTGTTIEVKLTGDD